MAVAVALDDLDDVRNHVAGALDTDAVTDTDAKLLDERGVVQRGPCHGDAADLDGVHERHGCEPAGPTHLDDDVPHRGLLLAGRELVGEGPAGCAAGRAQPVAGVAVVDLQDDAVDLVVEVVAGVHLRVSVVDGRLDVVDQVVPVTDAQPPLGELLVDTAVTLEVDARVEHAEEEDCQRPFGRNRRVELPQGAGRGVAGVRERVVTVLDALAVVRRKGVTGHVHLAPHREEVGVVPPQPLGDARDGPDVRGDVLADLAVTAGRGPLEDAVLVDHLDREPVELRLTEVPDVALEPGGCQATADPSVELACVVGLAALVDRAHRRDVIDLAQFVQRFATDTLGRTVRRGDVERALERLQASKECIVGPVGDDRVRLDVVAIVVIPDRVAQLLGLLAGRVGVQRLDVVERRRRVLDVRVVREV